MTNRRNWVMSFIAVPVWIILVSISVLAVFTERAMAQETQLKTGRGYAFLCLQEKWPDIQSTGGHVFVPETGQNLEWDKDKNAWIDVKTLQPVWGNCKSKSLRGVLFERCLQKKWPDIQSSGGHVFVPETGQNLEWDDNKQAWIDTKTLECVCPICDAGQPTEKQVIEKKKEACDLEFGYDYMRAPDESAKNLNGFGGSLFCNVKPWIAIGGDFNALFGSTTDTVGTTRIDVSLHRQTFLFGPQFGYTFKKSKGTFKFNSTEKIFVHVLVGGVHDATKTTIGTTTTNFSASAFAMAFGGGVDVNLNHRFAIRPIQFDFVPTHFGGQWQSNYQISTGLVIRLGEKK